MNSWLISITLQILKRFAKTQQKYLNFRAYLN